MQAVYALARFARDDAKGAVSLYFEPLAQAWLWLKNILSNRKAERKTTEHPIVTSEALETTRRSFLSLGESMQVRHFVARNLFLRPQFLPDARFRLLESLETADFSALDLVHSTPSLRVLSESMRDLHRVLLEMDRFRVTGLYSTPSIEIEHLAARRSSNMLLDYGYSLDRPVVFVVGMAGVGKTSLLRSIEEPEEYERLLESARKFSASAVAPYLMRSKEISSEYKDLLESAKEVQDTSVTDKFGVYLEVAAFLMQEGYEDAAAAVMARAFRLFRLRQGVSRANESE